ncbi:FMN-binding negative transcriptional regulator [Acinetobacter haemolyticus]|uniref:FMN-binding negative transcriptional regulator n=1 Tax=Acinetobacter haemolyticus TaxID=29430 RepID=UPI002DB5D204|nr:FMN-binding negative transcriptional regulator [Acinetobacter haemolyticus]MEB6676995.1 FMN-binding negative transcriptional regulator [Acinetobacter haemolyticus]
MYIPQIFKETRLDVLHDLIRQYPFATLITQNNAELDAMHLPIELLVNDEQNATLVAHIAKNNPLHTQIDNGAEVLVIFQGQQGYISPNWYPSKQQHHQHVPTWNYQVVHVKGKIYFSQDEKVLRGILARLTRTHEAKQDKPWKMSDAPSEYIAEELRHIVAVEIQVSEMVGQFKMSQNRDPIDAIGIVESLEQQGNTELAQVVKHSTQSNN